MTKPPGRLHAPRYKPRCVPRLSVISRGCLQSRLLQSMPALKSQCRSEQKVGTSRKTDLRHTSLRTSTYLVTDSTQPGPVTCFLSPLCVTSCRVARCIDTLEESHPSYLCLLLSVSVTLQACSHWIRRSKSLDHTVSDAFRVSFLVDLSKNLGHRRDHAYPPRSLPPQHHAGLVSGQTPARLPNKLA